jgi:hypothetical protein
MAGLADPNAAVELSLNRAARLIQSGEGNTLSLLQAADRELLDRLQHIAKKHGGPAGTYTEAHAQIYRQQIRLVTNYVQQRMLGKTDEQAREAIKLGVKQTVALATKLEEHWTGITRPLALHSQTMQDEIVRGTGASRIRQNEASWQRYGDAMTRDFERQLRLGQLMGLSHHEVISRVISVGAKGGLDAAKLHEQTPGSFPAPTGYVARRYWAERIVRTECLTGDTLVHSAVITAVHRRWYEGVAFEIIVDGGRKFTATPNHPMLTRGGWVVAGELQKGDDLIGCGREQHQGAACHENVTGGPTAIGEIFDTVAAVGIRERRRTTQPDFHGDGLDGEVDIFRPNRPLTFGRFAPIYQPLGELIFSPTNEARLGFCHVCGALLPFETLSHSVGAHLPAGLSDPFGEQVVANAEFATKRDAAFSSEISRHYSSGVDVVAPARMLEAHAQNRSFRLGAQCAGCAQNALNGTGMTPERTSNSECALSGGIQFNRVLGIRRVWLSGHVFNLSTTDGYYALNAAYTGNTAYAYNAAGLNTMQGFRNTDFPDMQKKILAHFDSRTAPDSIAVHGQIRPLDGYFMDGAGRQYLHPPGRPNDRETVIPWRPHWGELDSTDPPDDAEIRDSVEKLSDKETAKSRVGLVREQRTGQRVFRAEQIARQLAQQKIDKQHDREKNRVDREVSRTRETSERIAAQLDRAKVVRDIKLQKLAAKEEAKRRKVAARTAIQMGRKPVESRKETARNVRELRELVSIFAPTTDPVRLRQQRESLARLPQQLARDHAAALVAITGAKVPVELAMKYPRLVAALVGRIDVRDWEDWRVQREVENLAKMRPEMVHQVTSSIMPRIPFEGIFIGTARLPDLDKLSHLRDAQPRGWRPGETWNEVGGAGGTTKAVISVSGRSGSNSTSLHEFGHVIGGRTLIDSSPELGAHHRRLYRDLRPYHQQGGPGGAAGSQEFFAESVGDFHLLTKAEFVLNYDLGYYEWLKKLLDLL